MQPAPSTPRNTVPDEETALETALPQEDQFPDDAVAHAERSVASDRADPDDAALKEREEQADQPAQGSGIRDNIQAVCIALAIAFFIRAFVVQPFKIPSGSMLPTLQIGDYILVNKFIYGVRPPFTNKRLFPLAQPQPGDIIVFKYPVDPKVDFIKRVIAVGGDVVEIRDRKLLVNGKAAPDSHAVFTDPELRPAAIDRRDNFGPETVPPDSLFVMGDNRDNSQDSRYWGYVKTDAVRGKAWRIYWSWDMDLPLFSLDRLRSIRWNRFGHTIDNAPKPEPPAP